MDFALFRFGAKIPQDLVGMSTEDTALLVVVGPTAAGKTSAVLGLCEACGGEVVSADSVAVYRGLDIGSAKPTPEQRALVPHHLIDIIELHQQLDAASWAKRADEAIDDIRSRGKVPIVCGGTGFYVRALLHGLTPIEEVTKEVRSQVRMELDEKGSEAMHQILEECDAVAAERIGRRDRQRIGRALEVFRQTGRPLSDWQAEHRFAPVRYPSKIVGLWPEREVLYGRINNRVSDMLDSGWLDEVRSLLNEGVSPDAPGLQTMGYRQVVDYLEGRLEASELAPLIAKGHRTYARRQMNWFRGITGQDDALAVIDSEESDLSQRLLTYFSA
jgi:tRNA dimethylallyltransferase